MAEWDFDDIGDVGPPPPATTIPPPLIPPETVSPGPLRFSRWFDTKYPGFDMVQRIDDYVDEYIKYLEENRKRIKRIATIKIQALQRGRRGRENLRMMKAAGLLEPPSTVTEPPKPVDSILVPSITPRPTDRPTGEDDWVYNMKQMTLSGIFNYTPDQLYETRRLSIFLQNGVGAPRLGFNVDSLDLELIGSEQGSFQVQWQKKEEKWVDEDGILHIDFPFRVEILTKDDFVRGYTHISGGHTIVSNSSDDILSVMLEAGRTSQVNIILCKTANKTTEETLVKWSKDTIPNQLANMFQNKFRKAISEMHKGKGTNRNSDGLFDHTIMATVLTDILNNSTGGSHQDTYENPVNLGGDVVREGMYFSYQPKPSVPPVHRPTMEPIEIKPMELPVEVGQIKHSVASNISQLNQELYASMFINYWFHGLTPELNNLAEQLDLRHIDYDKMKTVHPQKAASIEQQYLWSKGGGKSVAAEKLFYYDFKRRRDDFNYFVDLVTKPLQRKNGYEFRRKFALFDLADLIPTALNEDVFEDNFLSKIRYLSAPSEKELENAGIHGRLSDADHKTCLSTIYYSLGIDLMSSGDIKLMFILLDKIKDMCNVKDVFEPIDKQHDVDKLFRLRQVQDGDGNYRVPKDTHRKYIQDFQKEMGFENPTQIRHGTLTSAFNEYVYNAEKSRIARSWAVKGNPYRAKKGPTKGGAGERLIRWFPRLGDMSNSVGMSEFPKDLPMNFDDDDDDDDDDEDFTPEFDFIDNGNRMLPKSVIIFPDARPPWMNTLYQEYFYWFLMGVFCEVRENDLPGLVDYLNKNIIEPEKRFKDIKALNDWRDVPSNTIKFQLLQMGTQLWGKDGRPSTFAIIKMKNALFDWYGVQLGKHFPSVDRI